MKTWNTTGDWFGRFVARWSRAFAAALLICFCWSAELCASPNSYSVMASRSAPSYGCDTLHFPALTLGTTNPVLQSRDSGVCATHDVSLRFTVQPEQAGSAQSSQQGAAAKTETASGEHRFWDRKNDWLCAAVGAGRTLDYFSTLNFRHRGVDEALLTNDIVDNHAAFTAIEAAATGVSIGASYLFHRYHHHRLERWTSILHAGLATGGAIRNYSLKSAHR